MKCQHCGKETADDSKHCQFCGKNTEHRSTGDERLV